MTKKELEKEAEEWIAKNSKEFITNSKYSPFDYAKAIYLAGTEPREKRIAELKAQIEKMKELLEKWYNQYSDKTYTDTFYQDLLRATEKYLWTDVEA